jgi:hypothetical protein
VSTITNDRDPAPTSGPLNTTLQGLQDATKRSRSRVLYFLNLSDVLIGCCNLEPFFTTQIPFEVDSDAESDLDSQNEDDLPSETMSSEKEGRQHNNFSFLET